MQRSAVKRHPAYTAEVAKLWEVVAGPCGQQGGGLDRNAYVKMVCKMSRVVVPPPWDAGDILQRAMDDWERDLAWAKGKQTSFVFFSRTKYLLVGTLATSGSRYNGDWEP